MKKVFLCITALVGALALTACSQNAKNETPVQLVSSIMGYNSITAAEKFAGVVTSENEVKVEKNENSEVAEIKVKAGDTVKAGDVLFTYNTEQISLNLEKAQLELEQLQASIDNYNSTIAQLEKDKAGASSDMQLSYELEIKQTQADLVEANYNVSSKQKEIDSLKKSLENASVKATVSGRIQSINQNGETDANGNPLPFISIVQTASYQIKAYVNEANIGYVTEGTKVVIRSRTTDETWTGTVSKIDYENAKTSSSSSYYESSTSETTTSSKYPFYITPDSSEGLLLGQHVYVEQDYGQTEKASENEVILPEYYIVSDGDSSYVWADNGKEKLEKRIVTLGEYDEDMGTYVITQGLSNEDYIAAPADNLKEGAKCKRYDSDVPEEAYPSQDGADSAADDGDAYFSDDAQAADGAAAYDEKIEDEKNADSADPTTHGF